MTWSNRARAFLVRSLSNPISSIRRGFLARMMRVSATRSGAPITFNSVGSSVKAQVAWFIKTVAEAGNVTVTLDVDSSAFSTYTLAGSMVYANSQTYSNNLRYAWGNICKPCNLPGDRLVQSCRGGRGSCFQLSGNSPSDNVWAVLETVYQTPNPPQWNAIVAFNH
jgi:hypothetical protein